MADLTSDELIRLQRRAGLSNIRLAQLTGRNASTVSRWRQGALPVPIYVDVIIRSVIVSSGAIFRALS